MIQNVYVVTFMTKYGTESAVYESKTDAEAAVDDHVAENWQDAVEAAEWDDTEIPKESPGGFDAMRLYTDLTGDSIWIDKLPVIPAGGAE